MMCCSVRGERRASNGSWRGGSACAADCAVGCAKKSARSAAATSLIATALAPAKQPLDIGEAELDIGRSPVVALAAMRRRLHLAQQRVHLCVVETAAGTHPAMAGKCAAERLEPLLQGDPLPEHGRP